MNDDLTALPQGMMDQLLGPMGPIIIVGVLGILLIAITVGIIMTQREDPLDKLKRDAQNGSELSGGLRGSGTRNEQLERYSKFLEPEDDKERSQIEQTLRQAGYRSKDAVRYFHAAKLILGVGGLFVGFILFNMNLFSGQSMQILSFMGPGLLGYYGPKLWVSNRSSERRQAISDGFPDCLDMLLVCVEAGQSFDQAIGRVTRELRLAYPVLAEELEIVSSEMKAGKDKSTVLRDFGERTGVQDVASFVTVMIQSAKFGTSIADALRVYSAEMRDKRIMRAEEKANKIPTKMTLATMMLTLPPLLIILIGPSVYNITQMGGLF